MKGLREIFKYDQILTFSRSKNIHVLAVQETKSDSVNTFQKNGWEILHPGCSAAKHHGVGFFVSSSLRAHVKNFLAHTPRICEATVCTNPHPITIFSIYAPSQVEDPNEDQSREESFWSQLDNIVAEHTNSCHILLLGDLNARLDEQLDLEQVFIGPKGWGRRQSIGDPLRDNAVYLLDFLQSHSLLLPQTFSTPPSKNLVPYKEMTTTTHLLDDFAVTDWTALDYALSTHPVYVELTSKRSMFQQVINTRQLPLLFTYRTSLTPPTKTLSVPKLDYSCTSEFINLIESELLQTTHNQLLPTPTSGTFFVPYTDGSCTNNHTVGPDNPAGWGFVCCIYQHFSALFLVMNI